MSEEWVNQLYFGDNLKVLRESIADESVDLIYLDPPFNSNATYNVLFDETGGDKSTAQIVAFEDTWRWGKETEIAYHELRDTAPPNVFEFLMAMRAYIGTGTLLAYLVMMAPRMIELHRILKKSGSLYLHCDPNASHYLKMLLDGVFGVGNFRSEIVWRRSAAHNKTTRQYGPIHDLILFYSKSEQFTFHPGYRPYTRGYIEDRFKHTDAQGIYRYNNLTGPGKRSGDSGQPWKDFNPTLVGRHWAIPNSVRSFLPNRGEGMSSQEQLDELLAHDVIMMPKTTSGFPMYKQPIGDGVPYQDIWIFQPNTRGVLYGTEECIDQDVKYLEDEDEKLGFATQKPIGLLARIIKTSSNSGDVILDPFCGCGTAVIAAELLDRRWIGIDITHLAITLIKNRLSSEEVKECKPFVVHGIPVDLKSAEALALENRHQFEWWAVGLAGGRPAQDKRKGADRGLDGLIYFSDDGSGKAKRIAIQVKSGSVSVDMIRDLRGVVEREKAVIGVFVTLKAPTREMLKEAASGGIYQPEFYPQFKYNRIQILTIENLLAGKVVDYPHVAPDSTYSKPSKKRKKFNPGNLMLI